MSEAAYKVRYRGGRDLSRHFLSLQEACASAKNAVTNRSYIYAEVVLRGSEIVVAVMEPAGVSFPDLTEILETTPKIHRQQAAFCRRHKNTAGEEFYLLKAETDAIALKWIQNHCRKLLG